MKRLIPFVLAVCCAVGLISGSVTALTEQSDDLVFREVVKYGDPEALAGRVIHSGIQSGEHMEWRTTYNFASENTYDTEFVFTQKVEREQEEISRTYMEVYTTNGMGVSTSGDMSLRNTGYGDMVRAVAAITPAGETREMNLKLRDYVEYHALSVGIHYVTDEVYCSETVSNWDHIVGTWHDETTDFDQWLLENHNFCYRDFSDLFRFPVAEDEIVEVSTTRDDAGNLVSMGFNNLNSPEINVICALNDQGAYCIPVFRKDNQPLRGEYRYGMGIYFIPWREVPGSGQYTFRGEERTQIPTVTLDVENAENILPMEDTAIVYGLEVLEDSSIARMISLEGDTYYLTEIDLEKREITSRLEVLQKDPEVESYWPNWQIRDNLMIIEACDNLALITLDGEPELEFSVPLGPVEEGYWGAVDDYAGMHYDGEKLVLAGGRGFYDDRALVVQVFDKSGPLYWGEYTCSVFACNDPGASPYIANRENWLIIE